VLGEYNAHIHGAPPDCVIADGLDAYETVEWLAERAVRRTVHSVASGYPLQ
jgi:hypothetical protein